MNKTSIFLLAVLFSFLVCPVAGAETDKELFDKGVTLLKNDQFQEAVDEFTLLVRQSPENPDAYKNRGVAYMKLGEYDLAILDFEKTRELMPEMKGLYSNLGVAWYYKGEYEKAIQNYNMEIALTPDNYYAFFNRAICRAELDDLTRSLEDVNQAIALSPEFYLAHCLRGDLLAKMGKTGLARQAYERAIEIDPDHTYAPDQLAALPSEPPPMPAPGKVVEKAIKEEPASPASDAVKQAELSPKAASAPEKTPEQPEAAAPPAKGETFAYELQAGAYQEKKNAEKMEKRLSAKGIPVRVTEMDRPNGKHWYLVRTGGYNSRSEAAAARKEMMEKLGSEVIIRPWGQF